MTIYCSLYDKPKDSSANDISIVFTSSPFTINQYVRPAALPKSSKFEIPPDAKTMVSGFGYTEKSEPSEKLQYAQIRIRPSRYCKNRRGGTFDDEKFLCGIGREMTPVAHQDACKNDSGGPLIAKVLDENREEKFTLVGIVSSGGGVKSESGVFHKCGTFGVYTKVSKYLDFIRDPIHNY